MELANLCELTLFLTNWNNLSLDNALSPGVLPSPQVLSVILWQSSCWKPATAPQWGWPRARAAVDNVISGAGHALGTDHDLYSQNWSHGPLPRPCGHSITHGDFLAAKRLWENCSSWDLQRRQWEQASSCHSELGILQKPDVKASSLDKFHFDLFATGAERSSLCNTSV